MNPAINNNFIDYSVNGDNKQFYIDKLNQIKNDNPMYYFSGKNYCITQVSINNLLDNCSICQDSFFNNDKLSILKCSHVFHNKCIKKWLENDKTCPIDRQEISQTLMLESLQYLLEHLNDETEIKKSSQLQNTTTVATKPENNLINNQNELNVRFNIYLQQKPKVNMFLRHLLEVTLLCLFIFIVYIAFKFMI